MKNTKELKGGVIVSYINILVNILIYLVYTPVLLTHLGQNEYGLYSACLSVMGYLSVLNFGFTGAYVRFYTRYQVRGNEKKVAELNGMFVVIFTVISIVVLILGSIMAFHAKAVLGNELTKQELGVGKVLLLLMAVNLALSMENSAFVSFISSREKFIYLRLMELVKNICNPLICLPLLRMNLKSEGITWVLVLLTFVSFAANIYFCWKCLKMKFHFRSFDLALLKEIAGFSFFIFLQLVMDQINWQVDKFLLVRICGSASVAVYTLGAQINSYYVNASLAVSSVVIPKIHIYVNEKKEKEISELFATTGRIQGHILMAVILYFWAFGQVFMDLWVGDLYQDSFYVAVILLLTSFLPLTQNTGLEVMRAKNQHKILNLLYLAACVVNIMISIPLCRFFGATGSALGTGIAMILSQTVINDIFFYYKGKIEIKRYYWELAHMLKYWIPCLGVGMAIKAVCQIDSWIKLCSWMVLYTIIYVFMAWFLGLNQKEKDSIANVVLKR